MRKKVSILVPVYNAEKYLKKCLDSILKQSYREIEVIIVDDSSTDNSKQIIEKYSMNDGRIVPFYLEENRGISYVRNLFLEKCTGDFIMFCDADDYMEKMAVEKAIYSIEDYDLIIFRFNMIKPRFIVPEKRKYIPDGVFSKKQFKQYHLNDPVNLYWGVLWNKCYRVDLIRNNKLYFEDTMEDVFFNIDYFRTSSNFVIISDVLYNYNQTNISMTRGKQVESERLYKGIEIRWDCDKRIYNKLIDIYNDTIVERDLYQIKKWILLRYYSILENIKNDVGLKEKIHLDSEIKVLINDNLLLAFCIYWIAKVKTLMKKIKNTLC